MLITVVFFWISLLILFFCYIGYGLVLFFINKLKKFFFAVANSSQSTEYLPVTIIIPAYNEGSILEQKVRNTLALDYPPGMLTIIFVTDGSTDRPEEILKKYPSILLLHQSERRGKLTAIKRAITEVKTPVVIFSDANAMLNKECIKAMVRHYANPATGGVAGEKKIISSLNNSPVGMAEGLYWSYESFMKKQDADFNTVVGAAGELYSIRTELFPKLSDDIILDDFAISMKVCLQGYKIEYEPGAFAAELPSLSLIEEEKRKVRISAGAYQSIGFLKNAMNIFKYPLLGFQYISRRLLRWVFCPPMLIVLLLTNLLLTRGNNTPVFYTAFLFGQLSFYAAAIAGGLIIRSGKKAGILTVPFYFVFMNYCLAKGFIKFLSGKQTVLWEKSVRQPAE